MIQLSDEQSKNVKKLIELLRSGKINQAKERLCRFDKEKKEYSFCVMGAACLVSGLKPNENRAFVIKDDFGEFSFIYNWNRSYIERTFGFPIAYQEYLAEMNDNGIPFKIIADMIEKHVQNGFQNYRIDNNDTLSKFHEQITKARQLVQET